MTKGEHEQYRPLPCVSLATWNLLSNLPTSQHRFLVRYADTNDPSYCSLAHSSTSPEEGSFNCE